MEDRHTEPLDRVAASLVMVRVQGECPMGCGSTLFLGEHGYVTCSWHGCPAPHAASGLLDNAAALRKAVVAMGDAIEMVDLQTAWSHLREATLDAE